MLQELGKQEGKSPRTQPVLGGSGLGRVTLNLFSFLLPRGSGRNKLLRGEESPTVLAFIFQQTGNESDTILGATLYYSSSVLQ